MGLGLYIERIDVRCEAVFDGGRVEIRIHVAGTAPLASRFFLPNGATYESGDEIWAKNHPGYPLIGYTDRVEIWITHPEFAGRHGEPQPPPSEQWIRSGWDPGAVPKLD